MIERNLDAKARSFYSLPWKAMFSVIGLSALGVAARLVIGLGMILVLSKAVPSMPNRACRFVFLFALGLAFSFLVNYFDVRLFGYRSTGWVWASITALGLAIWGTFWPLEPHKSNAP